MRLKYSFNDFVSKVDKRMMELKIEQKNCNFCQLLYFNRPWISCQFTFQAQIESLRERNRWFDRNRTSYECRCNRLQPTADAVTIRVVFFLISAFLFLLQYVVNLVFVILVIADNYFSLTTVSNYLLFIL